MENPSTKTLMYSNISGEKYDEMDKLALEVLLDYGAVTFPLDIAGLAKKIGINLIPYSSLSSQKIQKLVEKNSTYKGVTCPRRDSNGSLKFDTFYNDIDIMPLAQRFTIAHEIKHVVCGDCFKKTLTEEDEVLAEYFARSLLAPQCMVIYQNEKDRNGISKHYEISLPSAENCYNAVENRKIKFGVDFLFQFEKDFIEERNKIL